MRFVSKLALVAIAVWMVPIDSALGDFASNPALRLESDSGLTLDTLGRVISWSDQSGNGHDASQGSAASRPTAVGGVFLGNPAVRFDGATDDLNIAGQVLTSQQFSIFAVVTDTSTATGYREIFSNWDNPAGNSATSVFLGTIGQNPVRVRFTDDFGGNSSAQPNGVGSISSPSSPFLLSGVNNASDVGVYQDTSLIASRNAPLAPRDFTTPYVIGRQGVLEGEYWSGDMAAILVYDRQLTDAERSATMQYLDAKYVRAVPEPSSFILLGVGAVGLLVRTRRRRVDASARAASS